MPGRIPLLLATAFAVFSCGAQEATTPMQGGATIQAGTSTNDDALPRQTAEDPSATIEEPAPDTVSIPMDDTAPDDSALESPPAGDSEAPPADPAAMPPANEPAAPPTENDAFKDLPTGAGQLKVLCSRPGQDKLRQVFCGPTPPSINGIVDLQKALGIAIVDPNRVGRNNNGTGGNAAFALSGGSSSLVGRFTSAINPRLVIFTPPANNTPNPSFVSLGFVRGEQFAEIAAGDPATKAVNFFLVKFEQDCNAAKPGCTPGDLLTPAVEANWRKVTVYEDTDIGNTIFDCKQCHQPGGPATPKLLRMQELRNPWTHFFRDNTSGGPALIADYQAAHGVDEAYAGIPGAMISSSNPAILERLVRDNGFGTQPNEFPTRTIESEIQSGISPTWQKLYDQFVAGTVIAPPFHDVKVSDPAKLALLTDAYQSFLDGTLPAGELPDIRDIFPDTALRDMGFMVKDGLSGSEIITQACTQCHNAKLPQDITRARFDVDLSKMSRTEKDIAIERPEARRHESETNAA